MFKTTKSSKHSLRTSAFFAVVYCSPYLLILLFLYFNYEIKACKTKSEVEKTSMIELFCENSNRPKAVNYFRRNKLSETFGTVLNTPLLSVAEKTPIRFLKMLKNPCQVLVDEYTLSYTEIWLKNGPLSLVNSNNTSLQKNRLLDLLVFLPFQNQPSEVFCKKMCFYKFRKIHRKTPVPESFLIKLQVY